jgi:hypothetical protein
MGEIVELFKKITPEDAKNTIIDNLKNMHHGKPVNEMCATRGLTDFSLASDALHSLIGENVVEVERISLTDALGRHYSVPLYRYKPF